MLQSHITEVSRSTSNETFVMVTAQYEQMTNKSMQNVSTAKSSKIREAQSGFQPPISQLQDRRRNHYATEACYTERYQEGHPLIHL